MDLLWLLLWPAIAIPAGLVMGRLLHSNLEHPDPANTPRPGPSPVPGMPSPHVAQAQHPHALRSPAPAGHGPIDYRLTVWECGRIRMWDGQGQLRGGRDCIKHVDWDAELRAETEGQP